MTLRLAKCHIQRLLDNTAAAHPDYQQLRQAEKTIHQLAMRINSVKESKYEEDLQETLRKLELLLITDVFDTFLQYIVLAISHYYCQVNC